MIEDNRDALPIDQQPEMLEEVKQANVSAQATQQREISMLSMATQP